MSVLSSNHWLADPKHGPTKDNILIEVYTLRLRFIQRLFFEQVRH